MTWKALEVTSIGKSYERRPRSYFMFVSSASYVCSSIFFFFPCNPLLTLVILAGRNPYHMGTTSPVLRIRNCFRNNVVSKSTLEIPEVGLYLVLRWFFVPNKFDHTVYPYQVAPLPTWKEKKRKPTINFLNPGVNQTQLIGPLSTYETIKICP